MFVQHDKTCFANFQTVSFGRIVIQNVRATYEANEAGELRETLFLSFFIIGSKYSPDFSKLLLHKLVSSRKYIY